MAQCAVHVYDRIEIAKVEPDVTRVTLHGGVCPCCARRFKAPPPAGLQPLEREGVLPALAKGAATQAKAARGNAKPTAKAKPSNRTTLIPQVDYGLSWPGRLQRHHQIWEELQFHLNVRGHRNAISVLLRALIELAVENYIKQVGVAVHDNDKFATRLQKVERVLKSKGKIDQKQLDVLNKFHQRIC